MKKIIIIIFFIMLLNIFNSNINFADDILDEEADELNKEYITEELENISAEPTKLPNINSRAAVIYDRNSKLVLYGKNENVKRPMASTTKIMTAIVVLEKANLSYEVEISKKAAGTGGSRLGLKNGDKLTVKDLLYGLMLCSGNDAAVALAEHIGGSVNNFANLMNNKAKELGLENTSFVTPHGLDEDNHYTTAFELAKITDYALNVKDFNNIVGTKNYTIYINGVPKNITNTNELLGNLNGVYGVKTGFTNGANRCLVTATKRGDMDIICVVLGADTKKYRTSDSTKLIEYAFANFEMIDLNKIATKEFENFKTNNYINVIKGKKGSLEYSLEDSNLSNYPVNKKEVKDINVQIEIQEEIEAPICFGKEVGELKILVNNNELLTVKINASESINKKQIQDYFNELITGYSKFIEKAIRSD